MMTFFPGGLFIAAAIAVKLIAPAWWHGYDTNKIALALAAIGVLFLVLAWAYSKMTARHSAEVIEAERPVVRNRY